MMTLPFPQDWSPPGKIEAIHQRRSQSAVEPQRRRLEHEAALDNKKMSRLRQTRHWEEFHGSEYLHKPAL